MATKIVLTCPRCGDSNWLERNDQDGAFECAACGDFVFTEDMCAKTMTFEENPTVRL